MVRIVLKKPYADGTVAVDLDPLSLLCRLAASAWRPRIVPKAEAEAPGPENVGGKRRGSGYRR